MPQQYTQLSLVCLQTQACKKCDRVLPVDAFDLRKENGRHRLECKECRRARDNAYASEHRGERNQKARERLSRDRERINADRREAYAKDGEAQRESARNHAAKNREREAARSREWRKNNPAKVRQLNVSWYARNREATLEQKKDWLRRNPEIARTNRRLRKARIRGAGGTITVAEWQSVVSYYGGHCAYCGCKPEKITMDHVIPVAKGGQHVIENAVPACMSCNARKSARDLIGLLQLDDLERVATRIS